MIENRFRFPNSDSPQDRWERLISDLDLPPEMEKRVSRLTDVIGAERKQEIREKLRGENREDESRPWKERRKEVLDLLVGELRQRADDLASDASDARVLASLLKDRSNRFHDRETPDTHVVVGENLSWVRKSIDQTQADFASDNLQGALARSTYAKLESGNATSLKLTTLRDLSSALGVSAQSLQLDKDMLDSLVELSEGAFSPESGEPTGPITKRLCRLMTAGRIRTLRQLAETHGIHNFEEIVPQLYKWLLPSSYRSTFPFRVGVLIGWMRGGESSAADDFVDKIEVVTRGEIADRSAVIYKGVGAMVVGHWSHRLQNYRSLSDS
jgi:transcriptional regulator with XRE-family HTH domain